MFLGNLMVASYASSALSGAIGWTYYHSDHLGTPRYITGAEGPFSPKYWPYGDEVVNNTTSQKLRFATMERDLESNHFYDHARSHDWKLGRFVGVDKLPGDAARPWAWNRYSYTAGNPISFIDPNGHERAIPPAVMNLSEKYLAAKTPELDAAGHFLRTTAHVDDVKEAFDGWDRYSAQERAIAIAVASIAAADVAVVFLTPEKSAISRSVVMLGHHPGYLEAAKRFGAFAFDIGNYWTWPGNLRFLNRAIARGSQFLLSTAPEDVRLGSTLEKELAHLTDKGYRIVKDDFTGLWKLVK